MQSKRPLLFVHGIYHNAWCFEERFVPYFEALSHRTHTIELPIGPEAFSMKACLEAVVNAWQNITPRPVVIGHSLGARLARAAQGVAPIDHAILLSEPSNGQLFRATLRTIGRYPLASARALSLGKMEALYHRHDFAEEMFFSGTVSEREATQHLERIRACSYPRFSMARVLALGAPKPLVANARVDRVVGDLDPTCSSAKPSVGSTLTVIEGAPHDLMLGASWAKTAAVIEELLRARDG